MMGMRMILVSAAVAVALTSVATADDFATPVATVRPPEGKVAIRSFAISPDGARLAYVEIADKYKAQPGTLRVVAIATGKEVATVAAVPYMLESLHWGGPDQVVLVEKTNKRVRVRSIPINGPVGDATQGPFDRAAVVTVDGASKVVTYAVTRGKRVEHHVATYDPITLAETKKVTVEQKGGYVVHPDGDIMPLWWTDGSTVVVGRRAGAYSPEKNIRLPHRLVRLDVLTNKVTDAELPVEDFARVTAEHRARPDQRSFVFSFRNAIRLVTDTMRSLKVSRVAKDYHAGSLHYQALSGERLLFSATSRRTRREPDGVEFYIVDLASGEPRRALTVAANRSFVEWSAAGGRVALLRKRQGARSGAMIDIFDLPTP